MALGTIYRVVLRSLLNQFCDADKSSPTVPAISMVPARAE